MSVGLVTVSQVLDVASVKTANGVFVEPQESAVETLIAACRQASMELGQRGSFRSDFLYAGVSAPSFEGRKDYFLKCWEALGESAPLKLLMQLFQERAVMRHYYVQDGEYVARPNP